MLEFRENGGFRAGTNYKVEVFDSVLHVVLVPQVGIYKDQSLSIKSGSIKEGDIVKVIESLPGENNKISKVVLVQQPSDYEYYNQATSLNRIHWLESESDTDTYIYECDCEGNPLEIDDDMGSVGEGDFNY